MAELSEKQLMFCREYIVDFNGKQAAIRAGYSERSAESQASRLLRNDKIQAKIRELIQERSKRTEITADRVVQEFAKIAFANIKDVVTWSKGGSYVRLKPMEEVDGTLIAEISNTENGVKVKLHDKMKALEALAKHTGVYDEKIQTTIDVQPFVDALTKTAQMLWGDNGAVDDGKD